MLIVYNREGLHHAGNLHLLPGLNDVDEKDFAEVSKFEAFKALVEEDIIEVLTSKDGKQLVSADIAKLPEKKAIELVAKTVSKGLLLSMQAAEKRQAVLDAISAQLDAINPKL
jgi:hypothetical protein